MSKHSAPRGVRLGSDVPPTIEIVELHGAGTRGQVRAYAPIPAQRERDVANPKVPGGTVAAEEEHHILRDW